MNAEEPIDTIPSSWEETCASEPIHTIGTVQSYGFLLVADIGSGKIVQVSSGIVAHWPGLTAATALLDAPLSDWVGGPDPLALSDLATLPEAHPVTLNARPQFEKTDPAANLAQAACWECLAHRRGQWALLEWLPGENCHNELRRQSEIFDNFGSTLQRLRHAEELGPFFDECLQVIQEFCQFDRVMIYRFLHDGAGEVIAERTGPALPTCYVGTALSRLGHSRPGARPLPQQPSAGAGRHRSIHRQAAAARFARWQRARSQPLATARPVACPPVLSAQ